MRVQARESERGHRGRRAAGGEAMRPSPGGGRRGVRRRRGHRGRRGRPHAARRGGGWLALALIVATAAVVSAAGPVSVVGRADRRQVTIGTPFRYIVEVAAPRGAELLIPLLGGELGEFSVVDFGEEPVREAGDQVVATRWYSLVAYRPGYLLIPGLTVQYRVGGGELARVDGEDVGIVVQSLLEAAPGAADIRDIKGPVTVPFDWTPLAVAGALVLGIAALALVAARLLRRINAPPAAALRRPPDVEALEALARLRERRLTEAEDRARWYLDLSAIVRTYIEGRFGLRAPEMTTEEFVHSVQRDSPLRPAHRDLLGTFLGECDLVKFARYVPDRDAAKRAYDAARRFVLETRPEPAPPGGRGQPVDREKRHAA